jgi:hypothetical protein
MASIGGVSRKLEMPYHLPKPIPTAMLRITKRQQLEVLELFDCASE